MASTMQQVLTVNHAQLADILTVAIPNRFNVLITGAPGIGKTDAGTTAAGRLKQDLLVSHPVTSEPPDYKGLPSRAADGKSAEFLPYGDLLRMMETAVDLVAMIDDLGQATNSVQASIMQLLLAREINGKRISDKVSFIACTNRRKDRAGVSGILEPVKSRFATIVELVPDWESWDKWAVNAGMPAVLVGFMRANPGALFEPNPTQDLINSPSPRTWAAAGRWINAGLPKSIRLVTLAGCVGRGRASELCTLWDMYDKIVDPRDALADPLGISL